MATKTITVNEPTEVVESFVCDNCNAAIPPVFDHMPYKCHQGVNMLTVTLAGGYGEYVDGASSVDLCPDCAAILRQAFPLFDKVLDRTAVGMPDWRSETWKEAGK